MSQRLLHLRHDPPYAPGDELTFAEPSGESIRYKADADGVFTVPAPLGEPLLQQDAPWKLLGVSTEASADMVAAGTALLRERNIEAVWCSGGAVFFRGTPRTSTIEMRHEDPLAVGVYHANALDVAPQPYGPGLTVEVPLEQVPHTCADLEFEIVQAGVEVMAFRWDRVLWFKPAGGVQVVESDGVTQIVACPEDARLHAAAAALLLTAPTAERLEFVERCEAQLPAPLTEDDFKIRVKRYVETPRGLLLAAEPGDGFELLDGRTIAADGDGAWALPVGAALQMLDPQTWAGDQVWRAAQYARVRRLTVPVVGGQHLIWTLPTGPGGNFEDFDTPFTVGKDGTADVPIEMARSLTHDPDWAIVEPGELLEDWR